MRRQEAIAALVAEREGAITITTEQAIGAWRNAVPEAANAIPDHLDIVGCMGSASTIGLGIALARPERRVVVVDGDGSLLMQLGSLVTIAGAAPANLFHFVFENGVYETSGSQPLPAEGRFDLAEMARAAGYAHVATLRGRCRPSAARCGSSPTRAVFVSVRTEPEDGSRSSSRHAPGRPDARASGSPVYEKGSALVGKRSLGRPLTSEALGGPR